ncbi:MAG TPA: AMP-binding protein [Xanthomonadaceae bacterium]|nr:AMP-binding protein [Xanthomonadaceae bacterium]
MELAAGDPAGAIAFRAGQAITRAQFRADVHATAAALPDVSHAIGLCAAALRGQVTLLPASRVEAVVAEVQTRYAPAYRLGDADIRLSEADPAGQPAPPVRVDAEALAVIGFTSGSTGTPQPQAKTWAAFAWSSVSNHAALSDLWSSAVASVRPQIVATVPAQHMYGMELSVLLPLLAGAAVYAGRPLFPEDVAHALEAVGSPRLLVITPVHLRALLESGIALPALAGIVSATAPLSRELARDAELRFGCELRELFGSTETCVIAQRRTATDARWTPYPGVHLQPGAEGALVSGPHLPAPVSLADRIEVDCDGRFRLLGRQADLLEIAGKRASLGDLNRRLLSIPGVLDGAMLQLDPAGPAGIRRIAAVVVAPQLDDQALLAALRALVDPVFLPRPLLRVAALPRNETGKLTRTALLDVLRGGMHSAGL